MLVQVFVGVHCHTGSLEIGRKGFQAVPWVHCHTGSLEKGSD
ncbi:hypothetical protein P20495_1627 [Pseudoalteromonas sp. BSi20495]|nr:hypothetical protein P20495_1627 [Pseudoalteromonas sp. BSi20495]